MALQLAAQDQDVEAFWKFCQERPQGVTQQDLEQAGWGDAAKQLNAANQLLATGRIEITQIAPGQLMYKTVDPHTQAKFRGLDREHMLVYQMIEKSGDKGCWSKVIKDQSNLQPHTITKVTKELIRRSLVKEVKSVAQRGRKVFMLWEIEPSKAVSGGTFYQDGEFAATWIEQLRQHCQQYIDSFAGKVVTLQMVHAYIQEQPGPSVPSQEDIQAIMRTLELDEIVYATQSGTGDIIYTARNRGITFDMFAGRLPSFIARQDVPSAGLTVPCLICPLQSECHSGGRICPEKCQYFTAWLSTVEPVKPPAAPISNDW